MIRSWDDAKEKFAKALELTSVIFMFGFPILLSQAFAPAGSVWKLLVPLISFVLAIALPTLVYGGPTHLLKWSIENEKHDGVAIVDLAHAPQPEGVPEVTFCVDLFVTTNSVWGWFKRKKLMERMASVWIEILPPQAAALKMHSRTGNASLEERDDELQKSLVRQFVVLPVTSTSETASQSRLVGSMVFSAVVSKSEDLTVTATLRTRGRSGKTKVRNLGDRAPGIKTIRIRS